MKVELECLKCPKTCENFLALCASGYYNNTIFHRNIAEFIVQGGDPTGTGKGGESIYGGVFEDELDDSLKHSDRGILVMANKGPNSNGSQFYFTYEKQEQLDGGYTVFGRIIGGLETLGRMERIPVDEKDRPKQKIVFIQAKIHANPFADGEIESNFKKEVNEKMMNKKTTN